MIEWRKVGTKNAYNGTVNGAHLFTIYEHVDGTTLVSVFSQALRTDNPLDFAKKYAEMQFSNWFRSVGEGQS